MKNIIIFLFIGLVSLSAKISQEELISIENKGYLTGFEKTDYGIIATNNLNNALYLIKDSKLSTLLENPGCGRYFNTFENYIGFKYIDITTAEQFPALYDLNTGKVTYLTDPSSKCGQVSFSDDGDIAYSVENDLIVEYTNGKKLIHDLGVYSNITPISPDGKKLSYHDSNQNIYILDLSTLNSQQITFKNGFFDQKWSTDSKKLAFRDISGKLYVYDLFSKNTEPYNIVNSYNWESNTTIHYTKFIHDEESLLSSDIYELDINTNIEINLTNTAEFYEYDTMNLDNMLISKLNEQISLKPIKVKKPKQKATLNVPYINQVYDTDLYAHRYGCCAATACAMVLAYYELVPHWLNTTNNWAHFIYDNYIYKDFTYDILHADGGTGGGDGFMWNDNGHGGSSPSTNQRYYLEQHGLTSVQYWSNWWNVITTDIANGNPHPMCVMLTASGHLIVPVGVADDSQQLLYYNDPYGDKNIAYPSEDGFEVLYDWEGYNTGHENLGSVAWTTSAIGSKPETAQLEIDDLQLAYADDQYDFTDKNNGFFMLAEGTTGMKYWRNVDEGSNTYWWTGAMTGTAIDDYSASWNPDIVTPGDYKVEVFIPSNTELITDAKYQIYHDSARNVVRVDQAANVGQWVDLGTYYFTGDDDEMIYLGDATGTKSIKMDHNEKAKVFKIVYDKVKFTPQDPFFTANGDWELGADSAVGSVSGEDIWGTVLEANHTDNTYSKLTYDLSAVPLEENSLLTFSHWYEMEASTEAYDGGNVKISTDNGNNYTVINPLDGYTHVISSAYTNPMPGEDAYSGESGGWVSAVFDLSAYSGQNILLQWQFGSDTNINERGWYIDEIDVSPFQSPQNVQIISNGTDVNITWDAVENAGSYLIYSAADPYGAFTHIGTSPTNSWEGIEGSNKYFYKITAIL